MAQQQGSLWFVTEVEAAETVEVAEGSRSAEDVGGGFGSSIVQQTRKSLTQRVQINAEDLKREIGNLLAVVGDVFDQARNESGLSLEEVELSIEVSSEGQISILGSGGKIGGTGGIKLSFKRQSSAGAIT
jgi:NTP pyrophosphatase (non-canonical NTP hydrolase)